MFFAAPKRVTAYLLIEGVVSAENVIHNVRKVTALCVVIESGVRPLTLCLTIRFFETVVFDTVGVFMGFAEPGRHDDGEG